MSLSIRPASPVLSPIARSAAQPRPAAPARPAADQPVGDSLKLSRPYNTLQRHGAFFDANNDHKVTVAETRAGLKDLGVTDKRAMLLAPIINAGLALPQRKLSTIDLDRINAQIDPKTPGAFDAKGNFDPAKFERMFAFDEGKTGSLTEAEVGKLIDASELSRVGKFRTKAGYNLLFDVAADTTKTVTGKNGQPEQAPAISRDRLKSFFLGTIFHDIAAAKGHPRPVHDGVSTTRVRIKP